MKKLQSIARKCYHESRTFKNRVDEIGMEILSHRRPNSKNNKTRLPYLVDFILEELPVLMTGLTYKSTKYQTLGYATKASSKSLFSTLANLVEDIKNCPDFFSFKQQMLNESTCTTMTKIVYLPIEEENVSK